MVGAVLKQNRSEVLKRHFQSYYLTMTNVIMYKYIETDRSIPTKSFNKYCQDTLNNQLSCNAY